MTFDEHLRRIAMSTAIRCDLCPSDENGGGHLATVSCHLLTLGADSRIIAGTVHYRLCSECFEEAKNHGEVPRESPVEVL